MLKKKIYKTLDFSYILTFLGIFIFSFFLTNSYAKTSSLELTTPELTTPELITQELLNRALVKQDSTDQAPVKTHQYDSIEDIDNKINELQEMKRGYESKAIRHDNQAQRLQFIEGELQNAKRNWKIAEDNRKIAQRIQKEIDELKAQRIQLQKKKR